MSKPTTASPIHTKSSARRDSSTASTNGPVNSMAIAMPIGNRCSDR